MACSQPEKPFRLTGDYIPKSLLRILPVVVLGAILSRAHVDTGAILGTVRDASCAVIPNATVTITNEGTAATLTRKTQANGAYTFTPLPIGTE